MSKDSFIPQKSIWLVLVLLFATGCSTFTSTTKGRVYRDMAIAGALGAALGQNEARYKNANSGLYAGSFAATAAVVSLLINDPDKTNTHLKEENAKLRSELDQISNPTEVAVHPGTLSGKIPEKYKDLVQPGEWKIYAIDQWIEDGENRLIHQDKMMELIPPALKPKQSKPKKESP